MNNRDLFINLVRLGIGVSKDAMIPEEVDWAVLKGMADEQGLSAIILDGLDRLQTNLTNHTNTMPLQSKLEWIGEVVQTEATYKHQQEVAEDMAKLFHRNGIKTYVLKGQVVAECYPRPEHRVSGDLDCFLMGDGDVWEKGNRLIEEKRFTVKRDFYKNSTFELSGLLVENHRYFVPYFVVMSDWKHLKGCLKAGWRTRRFLLEHK